MSHIILHNANDVLQIESILATLNIIIIIKYYIIINFPVSY